MVSSFLLDSYGNVIHNLTQWDVNQKLIVGVNQSVAIAPRVHFCNKNSEKALVVESTLSDNKIVADIPNILLQEPYRITAYVYLETDIENSSWKTIQTIEIPVRKRPKPDDYEYVENVHVIYLSEMIKTVERLEQDVRNAEFVRVSNENTRIETANKAVSDANNATVRANNASGRANDLINDLEQYGAVKVSDTEPESENVDVWIDDSERDEYTLPEINDSEESEVDTWSSKKIAGELDKEKKDIAELKGDLTQVQYNEPISWTLKKGISSSGVEDTTNYSALSQHLSVNGGDIYRYEGDIRDSANIIFSIYLHFYKNGEWQSRINVNINKDPITIPDGIDTFRIMFGRTTASGVQISEGDLSYYKGRITSFAQIAKGIAEELEIPKEYTVTNAVELLQLFVKLKDNKREKIIYLQGGEYDVFDAYKSLNIPSPPSGTSTSDYFDYNVFVPLNTSLIGRGDVVLNWLPTASQISAVESQIWSPINVLGSIHMENITLHVKNGRYCIHDDGHNKNADTIHEYKNVACIFENPDSGYTLKNTIGFGFDARGRYNFEGCTLINNSPGTNDSAFYGHGSTKASANQSKDSASITVKDCVMISAGANTVRLQAITNVREHIKTLFSGCHIAKNVLLTQLSSVTGAKNPFDVTLLKSGTPTVTVTDTTNPYEVKIYA